MIRGPATDDAVLAGVGDIFVMKMHYPELGDYEMINHVVEYEPDRRITWEPEAGHGHPNSGSAKARWGQRWTYDLRPAGPGATIGHAMTFGYIAALRVASGVDVPATAGAA